MVDVLKVGSDAQIALASLPWPLPLPDLAPVGVRIERVGNVWRFPAAATEAVLGLLTRVYGSPEEPIVRLRIACAPGDLEDAISSDTDAILLPDGREAVVRRRRDWKPVVGDGIRIEGAFPDSGGSRDYPKVAGAFALLVDLPASVARRYQERLGAACEVCDAPPSPPDPETDPDVLIAALRREVDRAASALNASKLENARLAVQLRAAEVRAAHAEAHLIATQADLDEVSEQLARLTSAARLTALPPEAGAEAPEAPPVAPVEAAEPVEVAPGPGEPPAQAAPPAPVAQDALSPEEVPPVGVVEVVAAGAPVETPAPLQTPPGPLPVEAAPVSLPAVPIPEVLAPEAPVPVCAPVGEVLPETPVSPAAPVEETPAPSAHPSGGVKPRKAKPAPPPPPAPPPATSGFLSRRLHGDRVVLPLAEVQGAGLPVAPGFWVHGRGPALARSLGYAVAFSSREGLTFTRA